MRRVTAGNGSQGSSRHYLMATTKLSAVWDVWAEDAHLNRKRIVPFFFFFLLFFDLFLEKRNHGLQAHIKTMKV